jgi:hypothetical protein
MKTLKILLLVAVCSPALFGQQQPEISTPDTMRTEGIVLLDPGVALGKPTLLLPPWLEPGATLGHPSFLHSNARPGVPPLFVGTGFEPKIDVTAPLRLQRRKDEGLQLLYSVLGAVQAGGVAYLAYRHVKKYGLR